MREKKYGSLSTVCMYGSLSTILPSMNYRINISRIFFPHVLGPALLTRGSFGAVRPAAARPI